MNFVSKFREITACVHYVVLDVRSRTEQTYVCSIQSLTDVINCFGGHSKRETPGHIPNPEAKTLCADGTAGGTLWESRTPPDLT